MICKGDKESVRMGIARIYEAEGIRAEMADKILREVQEEPIYVKFEAAADSQNDLFDEEVKEPAEPEEIDQELDIF